MYLLSRSLNFLVLFCLLMTCSIKAETIRTKSVPPPDQEKSEEEDNFGDEVFIPEDKELPESAKMKLPCEDLQKCLNKADRSCWAEFYKTNRAEKTETQPLVNLIFNEITQQQFLAVVDKIEADYHDKFQEADEAFADCMGSKGYRNYMDYCSNQRPIASEIGLRIRRKAGVKEEEDNCWKKGLIYCMNDYPFLTPKISNEMASCDEENKITESEIAIATTVGKTVMTNVLKLKAVTELLDLLYAENNKQEETEKQETSA